MTSTRDVHGDHGFKKEHALSDLVSESGKDSLLGPLSCDHRCGRARNRNKEVRQGLGRVDARIRREMVKFQELVFCPPN